MDWKIDHLRRKIDKRKLSLKGNLISTIILQVIEVVLIMVEVSLLKK